MNTQDVAKINLPVWPREVVRPGEGRRARRLAGGAGRRGQTLTDLSVRDTWEITPDQVTLTGLDWDAILAEVRDELGLPPRARLRAEPHALLVYGKGQFFLSHQDSEKDDTMIGTLVVSLPWSHTGGELVIEHNGKTVAYQASTTEVSVAAFYADCKHQVNQSGSGTGSRLPATCCWTPIRPARFRSSRRPRPPGTSPSTSPGSPGGKATTGSRRTGSSTCWTTSTPSAG